MAKITWDQTGTRLYETGVSKAVLYTKDGTGKWVGVAWNGITAITESPAGAELSDLYADDIKYASLRSTETFGATIEAYTYPDEFMKCDGSAEAIPGVMFGQQSREYFCLSYVTKVGSDTEEADGDHYKLHLIYNATASPSEKAYQTVNDSPEAITFSWEVNTVAINVDGYKAMSTVTIDSGKVDATKLKALEDKLYGTESEEPTIPMPNEIVTLLKTAA